MADLTSKIAAGLDRCFAERGFTEPSVDELKGAAGVSLRTLYKYFPSREMMIVGALQYRHQCYLQVLPPAGLPKDEAIQALFTAIQHWMETKAPNGCMDTAALVAHGQSEVIQKTIATNKQELREHIAHILGLEDKRDELFFLHEAAVTTWPVLGPQAISSARSLAEAFIEKELA